MSEGKNVLFIVNKYAGAGYQPQVEGRTQSLTWNVPLNLLRVPAMPRIWRRRAQTEILIWLSRLGVMAHSTK